MNNLLLTRRALALPALITLPAHAAWPERPVRIVVGFAPGGNSDTIARIFQPRLAEALGQPIIVENRAGAGGTLGAIVVARAAADGYTLLQDSASHVVADLLFPNMPVDFRRAFTPVSQVTAQPYAWITGSSMPAPDMASFLSAARDRRGGLTYGTPGAGSIGHIAGEAFAHGAGFAANHIPYKGGAEAAIDLASGALDAACITISSALPLVESGRARFLAMTSGRRSSVRPEVLTIAETAVPGFDVTSWNAVMGPAGLPAEIVARLSAALRAAGAGAMTRSRLLAAGAEPEVGGPTELEALLLRDRAAFGAVVRRAGLTR